MPGAAGSADGSVPISPAAAASAAPALDRIKDAERLAGAGAVALPEPEPDLYDLFAAAPPEPRFLEGRAALTAAPAACWMAQGSRSTP
jgi:hypothetical protein